MPGELLLINPRRKRRGGNRKRRAKALSFNRNPRRRKRSGARRMSAAQRRFFGKRRRRTSAIAMQSNPRRRRRSSRARRRYTVMRRNPRDVSPTSISGALINASIGAAGAVALDYIFNNYAPASFYSSTMMTNLTKIAGAIGLGIVGGMVAGKKTGAQIAAGALTVTIYDIASQYMSGAQSGNGSGQGNGGYGQGQSQMGRRLGRRMSRMKGLGWTNAARNVGFPGVRNGGGYADRANLSRFS